MNSFLQKKFPTALILEAGRVEALPASFYGIKSDVYQNSIKSIDVWGLKRYNLNIKSIDRQKEYCK